MVSVGIDLGGSAIKWALLADDNTIVECDVLPTPQSGADAVLDEIAAIARRVISSHREVCRVGIAVPASVNSEDPVIRSLPNIPGDWEGRNIQDEVERRTEAPVVVLNDARAFAYSQWRDMDSEVYRDVIFVALGTGVGGGLVLGGHLQLGSEGLAGEIGHVNAVHGGRLCGCGARGCLEMYAGGLGVLASAQALGWVPDSGVDGVEPGDVFASARLGNPQALEALDIAASSLGRVLGHVSLFLNPRAIMFGGGLSSSFDLLVDTFTRSLREHLAFIPLPDILIARDSTFAGARGAGLWAQQHKEKEKA